MGMPLETLFQTYDTLVVLDTETSGLRFEVDEIIELAAVSLRWSGQGAAITEEYDQLIQLSPGRRLDPRITQLTGITQEELEDDGIPKSQACREFAEMLSHGRTLIVAYNAHFDLSFLYYFLRSDHMQSALVEPDFLDALSVYKDRQEYPHKLKDAIVAYHLEGSVVNSHRAIDDVKATVEVLKAMDCERCDLIRYVNLFGYNPKFGVQGKRIGSVTYVPQPYHHDRLLYETCGDRG